MLKPEEEADSEFSSLPFIGCPTDHVFHVWQWRPPELSGLKSRKAKNGRMTRLACIGHTVYNRERLSIIWNTQHLEFSEQSLEPQSFDRPEALRWDWALVRALQKDSTTYQLLDQSYFNETTSSLRQHLYPIQKYRTTHHHSPTTTNPLNPRPRLHMINPQIMRPKKPTTKQPNRTQSRIKGKWIRCL
jgi:hypothetical protein